jgi:hypothetical protein
MHRTAASRLNFVADIHHEATVQLVCEAVKQQDILLDAERHQ